MSSADRVSVFFVKEVTKGVTPDDADFSAARITGESLKVSFETETSKELDPDRNEREQILVGRTVSGDLMHELYFADHDELIAAALGSVWGAPGVGGAYAMSHGSTLSYFSVLKRFTDLTNINHIFKGCVVNTWSLNIPKKGIVTGSFGLMGMDFDNGGILSVTPGTATFGTASDNDPFGGATIESITFDNVPFTSCVDSLSFQFTNNIRAQECAGSLGPTDFTLGRFQATGSADVYFKDETLFAKYKDAEGFQIKVVLVDPDGNKFSIEFYRAKFDDMEVVAGGTNTDIVAKCKFRALYDSVSGRMVRLVQDPAA
jgi:hypothetical protein